MKIMVFFAIFASLFGCGKESPQILDGPGMVYVDSDYRTEYANCLPFENISGGPYLAIAYLGKGDEGENNKDKYIEKIFAGLSDDNLEKIKEYDYEGDDWFLVIPKYKNVVDLKKGDEILCQGAYTGEAFVVKCNQDIAVNVFDTVDVTCVLAVDENGRLKTTDDNIWDITGIDEILKNKNDTGE